MQVFQKTQTWQLAAQVVPTPYGHHLIISSFVPTARRPEHQVKFSGTFSKAELLALRDTIDQALTKDDEFTTRRDVQCRSDAAPAHIANMLQ